MPITSLFAGLLSLLFIALSVLVIVRCYQTKTAVGAGADDQMQRRIRAHANFAEYTPLVLLLMALCETAGSSGALLQALGAAFVAGRISHAYSMVFHEPRHGRILFRQIGMVITFSVLGIFALMALSHGLHAGH